MHSAAPALLIAVTGSPGEGKTRLLADLAAHQVSLGQRVEGFVAIAGPRSSPDEGATDYRLRMLVSGEDLPWALRDESLSPPYRFDSSTFTRLQAWARALPRNAPLVVLDEFAKFESRGEGLMPLWPDIAAAAPRIAAIAVRADLVGAIEEKLGRRFDLVVPASAPDARDRLLRACADFGEWTRIGLFGGASGGIEMTAGSAMHALNLPLRGLAMSSLQAAMMTFTGFGLTQPARTIWVPFISAGLKALSPAGNRFRPMIAICVQGSLYGLSVQVLGWNAIGVTLGGALVGAWAAMQGFFLQYLMLGGELLKAYDALVAWLAQRWHVTAPGLPWLLAGWALFHATVAGSVTFAAWRRRAPPRALQEIIDRETAAPSGTPAQPAGKWRRVLRDFGRWQFWLPLLLVSAVLLAAGRPWESVARTSLRFVAVGLVIIALVSVLRPAGWAGWLRRRGWWGPALALSGALRQRSDESSRR